MPTETYPDVTVYDNAEDVGDGYKLTEISLGRGETAWNPLSTKGPLFGPGNIAYLIHASGINVTQRNVGVCLGGDRLTKAPFWKPCGVTNLPAGLTRCPAHQP